MWKPVTWSCCSSQMRSAGCARHVYLVIFRCRYGKSPRPEERLWRLRAAFSRRCLRKFIQKQSCFSHVLITTCWRFNSRCSYNTDKICVCVCVCLQRTCHLACWLWIRWFSVDFSRTASVYLFHGTDEGFPSVLCKNTYLITVCINIS